MESGSVFNGFIHLKDVSGTKENPIEITKYGGEAKPIINGDGEGVWYQDYVQPMDNSGHRSKGYVSSTVLLYDTDFIKINNLEITNKSDYFDYLSASDKVSARMDRTGVAAIAKNGGTMESIYLEDLYIHDVDGNIQDKHMNNGGIQMNVSKPDNESETGIARYDDIVIRGCHVKDVSRAGIVMGYTYNHGKFNGAAIDDETVKKYGHTNILIEENYVQNSGNDAICVMYSYRPLIQKNVSDRAGVDMLEYSYWQNFCATIWPWKCKDAIFKNNEAFDTIGQNNGDGQAWDIDWSDGTVYQYNYSHNNGGGAMLICLNEAYNGVFRYNISQNDLNSLITFQGNPLAKIYNNVFYVDGDRETRIHHPQPGKRGGQGYLANNIFYNISTGNPNDEWEPGNQQFKHNLYYGYDTTPNSDKFAITEDPKFINPGSAPTSSIGKVHDISVFDGYKVKEDSPVINSGIYVAGGNDKDFFGNIVGLIPDIGIQEVDTKNEKPVNVIYSNVYNINENDISGVEKKTTVSNFISNFKYSNGVNLKVLNGNKVVNENEVIKSGYKLKVTFVDGSVKEYIISANEDNSIHSSIYMQDESNKILYVPSLDTNPTTVSELKEGVITHSTANIKVFDGDKEIKSENIKDGMTLKVIAENAYTIKVKNDYQWALDYTDKQGNVWFAQKKSNKGYKNLTVYDSQYPQWNGNNYGGVGIDAPNHSTTPSDATHGLLVDTMGTTGREDGHSMVYRVPKSGVITLSVKDDEPYLRQSVNSADISWEASTDNVGVVAYEIYNRDVLLTTITEGTSARLNELTAETEYNLSIKAVDAAGNKSEAGTISFTTKKISTRPNNGGKLPQTGGMSPIVASSISMIAMTLGTIVLKKKKNK